MADTSKADQFKSLAEDYFRGRIDRRRFMQLGRSTRLFGRGSGQADPAGLGGGRRSAARPTRSRRTSRRSRKQRVAFLKTKPYKGTTINVHGPEGDGRRRREISRPALGGG